MRRGIVRRIKLAGDSERGVVLPVVIGLGLAMLMLVAVGMSSAASGTIKTNNDEDIKGAISAAYAGVQEYQSRLALDSTYYKFGNPTAPFSLSSASGLTLPTGTNYNPAFDATPSGATPPGKWAEIPNPDSTDPNTHTGSFFRYEVDNSDYAAKGVIRLLATGKVGNVTESVVASLKQTGFLDFLYFTDYETTDPIFYPPGFTTNCAVYLRDGRDTNNCTVIQFGPSDVLGGPVHSNDTLIICGSTFTGTVTTSNTTTPLYQDNGCGAPVFKNADGVTPNPTGAVAYEAPTVIPPTNSNMKSETYTDIPSTVPNPGCLYTGPTTITFLAGGQMNVVSPYTKFTETNTAGTVGASSSALDLKCGSISALNSTAGATIPVLDLNLIYVQNVPTLSTDKNYWAAGATPPGLTCLSQNGTAFKTDSSGHPLATYSDGFKFGAIQHPAVNEFLPWSSTATNPAYSCRNGDLYVSGTLKGHTTLASQNYIYVTDDLKYTSRTSDILGLVPDNALWIYNPIIKTPVTDRRGHVTGYTYSYGAPTSNLEIDAALLSVKHTVQVQNYDAGGTSPYGQGTGLGQRGTLTIFGAIAQKFRGTVALLGSTGYVKDYQYDTRFHNTAPPKFLTPVSTTYKVSQYSGTKKAYQPDGTPIP
jgi:hypothetical protein